MTESVYLPRNSRIWHARAVRPRALDHLPGPKDFRKSTGQHNKAKAKVVAAKLVAAQRQYWLELLDDPLDVPAAPAALTPALVKQLCAFRLYCQMQSDEDQRRTGLTSDELDELEDVCAASEQLLRLVLRQGPEARRWGAVLTESLEWAECQGYILRCDDPLMPEYVRALAKTDLDANAAIAKRNQGDDVPTPARPMREVWAMSNIIPHYLEHKGPQRDTKHVQTIVNAWRLLAEYCGDLPVDAVTPEHIYDFLLAQMRAEHKPWSYNRARTFGQRVLREFFGFARTKGFMTAPNPIPPGGLEAFPVVDQGNRHEQPRFPFTGEQLNTLFASEWYDPASTLFQGKMRADLGARYWLPLLGLHHGNRVGEGVQLVASDFLWQAGVLVLNYRIEVDKGEETSDGRQEGGSKGFTKKLRSLKCDSSRRSVPVHPKLIELGFAEFVESRRCEGGTDAWLFPSCEPEAGGKTPKLGRAYEQAFLRHVRDRLNFGNGYGNHSFRHLLEDKIRDAQARNGTWPAGLSQQYTGRVTVRRGDKAHIREEGSEVLYGNGFAPSVMVPYVVQLDFSDVKYPPAYLDWLVGATA